MIASLTLSFLLVALFVGAAIWKEHELPDSISAMVYLLPKGGWRWLWTAWLIAVSVLTFLPAIEILDKKGYGFIGFLPMVCLCFVAVWPLFDVSHRKYHYIMAVLGGILSQISVVFISCWCLMWWILLVVVVIYVKGHNDGGYLRGKGVFVAEMICYLSQVCAPFCTGL